MTTLEEEQEKESLNEEGVMKNSTLNVEILDIKGLEVGEQEVYIHLLCGGYNLYSEKSTRLSWTEHFQLPIVTGQEELMLTVQQMHNNHKDSFLGQCIV